MKKLITFIGFMLFVAVSFAQTQLDTGYDKVMNSTESRRIATGTADQVTAVGDSAWSYVWYINTQEKIISDVQLRLKKLGGTASAQSIWLSYKQFPGQGFTASGDTVTWAGTVDTTVVLSTGATALKANYIKVNYVGADDAFFSELLDQIIKVWR